MKDWRNLLNFMTEWRPATIARNATLLLVLVAFGAAFIVPMDETARNQLLFVTLAGFCYAVLSYAPILPDHHTLIDSVPFWMSILDAAFISMVVYLFFESLPLSPILYLTVITGIAIRRGIRLAFWSALVSSIGFWIVLTLLGGLEAHIEEALLLTSTFIAVGIFTGSLAQAAQRRGQEFENVLKRSHDAIILFDHQAHLEYLNPAMLAITGYNATEVLGRSFFDFITDPIDLTNTQQLWEWLKDHPVPNRSFVVHVRAKKGETRILSATLTCLNPNPARYMAVSRDITQAEMEREAHERRDRELEAERQVALAVSQRVGLDSVLKLALNQALLTLHADVGCIYLANDAQTELTLAVWQNLPDEFARQVKHFRFGEGITGRAVNQKQVQVVSDLSKEPNARRRLRQLNIQSQISVPLVTQDRVVGVLNVHGIGTREFTEADVALLRAIASNLAIGIDHTRLFESLEQRVQDRTAELVALNRIARAGTQSLELDEVLNSTLREVVTTLQVRGGWIALVDHAQGALRVSAQLGIPPHVNITSHTQPLGRGFAGKIALDGQPSAINLIDSNFPPHQAMHESGIESLCGVPLIAGGQTLGILGLASDRLDRFGEAELRWLTAVASTMAFALRNAQLYTSVGRQVTKLATLREIDRTLNSTRELEPMLEIILTSIAEVVPYDFAAVYLLDGSIMRAVAGRGVPSDRLSEYAFETKGDVTFDQMAYERRPITIGDLHPKKLNWSILPGLENIHSWMGTPLIARDAIIGQISLYHSGCNVYTNEHIDWMVAFSNHAAIAIANALLRAELNKQARQDSLTQVLNHGAFIEELRNACQQSALTERPLSLIMLDLDNFKKYNDTYGHVVGDAVLTLTAQTIRKHIKHTDFVGRWGGEEFGIAMPRTDTVRALVVAERIRKTLTETRIQTKSGEPIPPPTASQGIASLGNQARDVDELIEEADRALYRAKSSGRDQIMVANRSISSRTNEMPSK